MDCDKKILDDIRIALKEDGVKADITTKLFVPAQKTTKAVLVAKEDCVVCGLDVLRLVLKIMDKNIEFKSVKRDGDFIKKGGKIACIKGKARFILGAERVMLNYICFLSGIATMTRRYVQAVKPYNTKILDTRKTIPGLRLLEKYAVKTGGGYNHRMNLNEMILIKDNHLEAVGGFSGVEKILKQHPNIRKYKIELEVKNLKELGQALLLNPDIIMLDNMNLADMKRAVIIRNKFSLSRSDLRPKLEASGGITLENIKKISACGVDMISVGALTHSVKSIDMSLEFRPYHK